MAQTTKDSMSPTDETKSDGERPGEKARKRRARRRPATIDLAATEVAAEKAEADEPEAAATEAGEQAGPDESAESEEATAAAQETAAEAPQEPAAEPGKSAWLGDLRLMAVVLVLGAILGGLVALGAYGGLVRLGLLPGTGMDAAPVEARIEAFKAEMESEIAALGSSQLPVSALDELSAAVQQLTQRFEAAEAALAQIPRDDSSERLAALNNRLTELAARLSEAEAAAAAGREEVRGLIEKMAASDDGQAASAAIGALTRRIDAVESTAKAEAQGQIASARAALRAEIDERMSAVVQEIAASRADVAGLRDEIATVAESAPAARSAAALAIAVAGLERAVNSGAPFVSELATVQKLAGATDEITALETYAQEGVARRDELAETFQGAASAAMSATAPPTDGFFDRLIANARRIVRIRPTGEVEGETTGAVLARAEAQLAAGDLAATVDELAALDPAAQAAMMAWLERAQARIAAERQMATLNQHVLIGLPAGQGTGAQ